MVSKSSHTAWAGATEDRDPVMIVDDETGVRDLMRRWLQSTGYEVQVASGADDAMTQMGQSPAAVALCDIRMPGHDGLWLAEQLRHSYPETAVIMATGVQDVSSAVTSLRQGVIAYLMKPFGRDRLRDAVQRGVEWHRAAVDARRWRESLEAETRERHRQLAEALASLKVDCDEAIDGVLAMLTINHRSGYTHAYRVAALAAGLAQVQGLDEATVRAIRRAALLHELGKLAMPESLLRKPAPLTAEEQCVIRTHPTIGRELARSVAFLADTADIIGACQEWVDGSGYPNGLKGEEIPIGSRVIALADAYDTMTRPRVFRDALTPSEALLEIDRCAGVQFDAAVVKALHSIAALVTDDADWQQRPVC